MIYVLIGMSLIFVAIGFIVTETNAKYLLSGYNTMREEEQKKVNIKAFIPYFRKFHIFLGISFLVLGLVMHYLINENAGGIFLAVYPIVAYIYFIVSSAKYSEGLNKNWNKVGVFILIGSLVIVIGLLAFGLKEDKLYFNSNTIEISGSYSETLTPSEIQSIELVDQLPKIIFKTNGFALGKVNKGYFKTEDGEIIKLILYADNKPYILLTKSDGKKIYFSAKEDSNATLLEEMKKALPAIEYKQ